MLSTPALHDVVSLAERKHWRLAVVGDPRQLQGVGRGGLLAELCSNGRLHELQCLHRFTHQWEAAASLQLRSGDPAALDTYKAHDRIVAGTLDEHLDQLAATWIDRHQTGGSVAVVASTNDHVDTINRAIQSSRLAAGHLDPDTATRIAGGHTAHVGDVVATRRNERRLVTSCREPVRNRDTWTVTAINDDGSITASHRGGHGDVTLPSDYVRDHVRLGYAATEHGWQSDTVDTAIALISPTTTRRGLYVATTRGRSENVMCVVTESNDTAEARDILDAILAVDRADIPATSQRRTLAQSSTRPEAPTPQPASPRCAIPDWFPAAVANAQRALDDGEARAAERSARRALAVAAVANADSVLADVTAATAADRDALHHAEDQAVDARRRHAAAQHRLDTAPRRLHRALRREVRTVEQQLAQAEDYLDHTRRRSAPAVERHAKAAAGQREAQQQLRNCDTIDRLDTMGLSIGERRLRVRALTTWHRWAQGHDVPNRALHVAYAVLAHQPGVEQQLADALSDALRDTPALRRGRAIGQDDLPHSHAARHELGLEL